MSNDIFIIEQMEVEAHFINADRILSHELSMKPELRFAFWSSVLVKSEILSTDSNLYRAHLDWCLYVPTWVGHWFANNWDWNFVGGLI